MRRGTPSREVNPKAGTEARPTNTGRAQARRLCHQKGSRGGGKGPEQIEKMSGEPGEKIGGEKGKREKFRVMSKGLS